MITIEKIRDYKPPQSGGPTSMITLIIPPNTNTTMLRQKINYEYQTAGNIKNNSNRKSVKKALKHIQTYLKNIKKIPDTGIALYSEQLI